VGRNAAADDDDGDMSVCLSVCLSVCVGVYPGAGSAWRSSAVQSQQAHTSSS